MESLLPGLRRTPVISGWNTYMETSQVRRTPAKYVTHDVSKVKFKKLTIEEIENYLSFDEYKDKAGSYAIQGRSGVFVEKIIGNMSTIIGLPTHKLYQILRDAGIM